MIAVQYLNITYYIGVHFALDRCNVTVFLVSIDRGLTIIGLYRLIQSVVLRHIDREFCISTLSYKQGIALLLPRDNYIKCFE